MKNWISFMILTALSLGVVNAAPVSEPNEEDESTKLNLWIPGFLVKWVADMVDDELEGEDAMAVDFMRNLGSMNICIREGEKYATEMDNKMQRKLNRLDRRDYASLMSVITDEERVEMQVRTNKHNTIKRVVVLVHEESEAFVYVKMHCKLKPDEVGELLKAVESMD